MGPALHFMRFWKNIYWIQLICYIVLVSGVWHSDLFFVCLFFFSPDYIPYIIITDYYKILDIIPCGCMLSCSVVSDSLWPHGLKPTSVLSPWDYSREANWRRLPFPPSGILPTPVSCVSSTGGWTLYHSTTSETPGSSLHYMAKY